jgi:hypothetical protein
LRSAASIGPAANVASLFNRNTNSRQSSSTENIQSISGTTVFSRISWTRHVTVALVWGKSSSIRNNVVTEALNAEFHAGNCVTEPNARVDTGFGCELFVIRLLVANDSSI